MTNENETIDLVTIRVHLVWQNQQQDAVGNLTPPRLVVQVGLHQDKTPECLALVSDWIEGPHLRDFISALTHFIAVCDLCDDGSKMTPC